ncbi:hypothetical protein [Desertivirga arenae]|uniref:hypothetical protein n=1 Tax=Desertivirga arenae TaxID=2810309 RepID=UPI001A97A941|nr:hypothetical protein [Pedobacter sp. SYSU D00823]
MKKLQNIAFILLLAGVMSSCNNTSKTTAASDSVQTSNEDRTKVEDEPLKGCYIGVLKRDTFQLAITAVNESNVEGSLLYNFFEKDRSRGTFTGTFINDVLLADYTFQSEGATSQRQVIFKKTAKGFIEGYGNIKSEGGKDVFVDTAAVKFDQSIELTRTDACLP